jgi:hypothetical protein
MAILNKTGITNGGTIQAEHVTRTIDALTGVSTDTIVATGSFTGSFKGSFIGNLTGNADNATTADYAPYTVYTQLQFGALAANSMLDATSYYFGLQGRAIDTVTKANPVTSLIDGRINYVQLSYDNSAGTLGSGESADLYIYNITTDTSKSFGTLKFSDNFASTGPIELATPVNVSLGDELVIKLVTPTWATNPTAVTMNATCQISAVY